jgi:phosphotransferase system IIA component
VAVGDDIVAVDLERMKERGIDMVSPVVVISGELVSVTEAAEVAAGDPLLETSPSGY